MSTKKPVQNTTVAAAPVEVKTAAKLVEKTKPAVTPAAKAPPTEVATPKVAATKAASKPKSAPAAAAKSAPAPAKAAVVEVAAPVPVENEKIAKVKNGKKPKPVRDSFTFPAEEYAAFAILKQRLLSKGVEAKKGELLRAGLAVLSAMSDDVLVNAVAGLEKLKTGRPSKS